MQVIVHRGDSGIFLLIVLKSLLILLLYSGQLLFCFEFSKRPVLCLSDLGAGLFHGGRLGVQPRELICLISHPALTL